ncbi:MAG: hypothetical protein AT715_06970 [Thermoproteus sp. JCHS_4]|nr:MAG: hypothetical protein AT715_06970 [Thermoproteus sp. JCHS_4]
MDPADMAKTREIRGRGLDKPLEGLRLVGPHSAQIPQVSGGRAILLSPVASDATREGLWTAAGCPP